MVLLVAVYSTVSCLLLAAVCPSLCFNLDLETRIIHTGQGGMWFGYDLDLYKAEGENWLFVGAPKQQTQQPGVRRGGAVFRCSTASLICSYVAFDDKGPAIALNGSTQIQSDFKSDQLFGATVVVSNDHVLACAPHYRKHFTAPHPYGEVEEPVGTCYMIKDRFSTIQEYSPCRQNHLWGYHRTGYCVAGFSAAINRENNKLFVGAPGAYYYSGSVIVQDIGNVADVEMTKDSPSEFDDIYLGYSTVNGDFDGDGTDDVAMGAPRGQGDYPLSFPGKVCLYDSELRNLHNISGDQDGAYFGGALAASDIDGDGFDDLIVGAPLFVHYTKDKNGVTKSQYEVGKVYVFFQGEDHTFRQRTSIVGFDVGAKQWSRFGYSIAAAGDLNKDGSKDFVVGAPYDGENRQGAIYVFHGKKGGMYKESTQVIYAEDADPRMTTFGFSLAAGKDVDGNDYPDVAVGAYKSSKAVIFRSRPVVSVQGSVVFKQTEISLKDKAYSIRLPGGTEKVAGGEFEVCLEYVGKSAPSHLDLDVKVTLDAKQGIKTRAHLLPSEGDRLSFKTRLRKAQQAPKCFDYIFYIPNTVRNKLSPIVVEVNYTTSASPRVKRQLPRARIEPTRPQLTPVLDIHVGDFVQKKIEFKRECGPDKVCIPDLYVQAKFDKEKFIIGTDDLVSLDVTVTNMAEDAYGARFFLNVPRDWEYISFVSIHKEVPVGCNSNDEELSSEPSTDYIFMCDVGNPLEKGKDAAFKITFSAASIKNLDASQEQLPFKINVNSTNPELDESMGNNYLEVFMPVEVEASFVINGISTPDIISFKMRPPKEKMTFDSDLGDLVTHMYEIRNDGKSRIDHALLDIYWPSYTGEGSNLLYLIGDARTSKGVECSIKQNQNVNPLSLTIYPRPSNTDLERQLLLFRQKRQTSEDVEDTGSRKEVSMAFRRLVEELKNEKSRSKVKMAGQPFTTSWAREHINCAELNCTQISCEIKHLAVDKGAYVHIDARLVLDTMVKEAFYESTISSIAIGKVTKLAYGGAAHLLPSKTAMVSTFINPIKPRVLGRALPWWLWLLAILAGLCLLILIILLCWRCGFFKRRRPPKEQALLTGGEAAVAEGTGDHYGYYGHNTGYAPPTLYSETQHGRKL